MFLLFFVLKLIITKKKEKKRINIYEIYIFIYMVKLSLNIWNKMNKKILIIYIINDRKSINIKK